MARRYIVELERVTVERLQIEVDADNRPGAAFAAATEAAAKADGDWTRAETKTTVRSIDVQG